MENNFDIHNWQAKFLKEGDEMEKTLASSEFWNLVERLRADKVPARVTLTQDLGIVIECGFDYPDELFIQISDILDELRIDQRKVDVCADYSSPQPFETRTTTSGGPRRY